MILSYTLMLESSPEIYKIGDKKYYWYRHGCYLREKLNTRHGCKDYRYKDIKPGVKLLVCIRNKEGKRGGHTKAISILRNPCLVDLRQYADRPKLQKLLAKLRKDFCGSPECKDKSKEWLREKYG